MKWILALTLVCFSLAATAQTDNIAPAYKRYPTLPALQLLLSDSTKYTKDDVPKKRPVLLVLYSPDCDHCQHEAEQLVANKEALKNIHIIMVTTYPLYRMNEFADTYGLAKLDNVVMTRDPYYMLPAFYQMRNFPFMALYNKKGQLIEAFEGSVGVNKILAAFQAAK